MDALQDSTTSERKAPRERRVQISEHQSHDIVDYQATVLMETIKSIQHKKQEIEDEKLYRGQYWDHPEHKILKTFKVNPFI